MQPTPQNHPARVPLLDRTQLAEQAGEGPSFYTVTETAKIFRLDESTLYRHLRAGKFPAVKIGGRYVVPREVVERVIRDVLSNGRCIELAAWTVDWLGDRPMPAPINGGA